MLSRLVTHTVRHGELGVLWKAFIFGRTSAEHELRTTFAFDAASPAATQTKPRVLTHRSPQACTRYESGVHTPFIP